MERCVYRHSEWTERTISIVQGDITAENVDVIVNAANAQMLGGGGVDGAIHRGGGPAILEECRAIRSERGPLVRGEALATTAGNLRARHVIHTAGPVYRNGRHGEEDHLRENYANSLRLAAGLNASSVAFPAISCGVYGYPFADAIHIALKEMVAFLDSRACPNAFAVRLVLFSPQQYEQALTIAASVSGHE